MATLEKDAFYNKIINTVKMLPKTYHIHICDLICEFSKTELFKSRRHISQKTVYRYTRTTEVKIRESASVSLWATMLLFH